MICIRFIADNSIESKLIRLRTNGKASHVEYVTLDDNKAITDTFGARLQGGIRHRPPDYCKPTWEEWYTFPGIEASYAEALKQDGRRYDWKDIVNICFGITPDSYDPERSICSVLVGYSNRIAWAKSNAEPLVNPNVLTSDMTPNLIYACVKDQVL